MDTRKRELIEMAVVRLAVTFAIYTPIMVGLAFVIDMGVVYIAVSLLTMILAMNYAEAVIPDPREKRKGV